LYSVNILEMHRHMNVKFSDTAYWIQINFMIYVSWYY